MWATELEIDAIALQRMTLRYGRRRIPVLSESLDLFGVNGFAEIVRQVVVVECGDQDSGGISAFRSDGNGTKCGGEISHILAGEPVRSGRRES